MSGSPDRSSTERPAASPPRTGRRHGVRPGVSLLAQGEPMIWLTGGALALAVAMIFGLLTLVLVSGAETFWPVPVERVRLADGTTVVGEATRSESYQLTKALLARLPEATQETARRDLGDREELSVRRRLFRTGNYELTQQHFVWVADFELAPDSDVEFDPWMIVLERFEWGRFFGVLESFDRLERREVTDDETQARLAVEFLESQSSRLSEEAQAKLAEPLARLKSAWEATRREAMLRQIRSTIGDEAWPAGQTSSSNTEAAASETRAEAAEGWELVLEDETAVPLAADAPLERAVGLRRVVRDPQAAWDAYESQAPEVARRTAEIDRLAKHEVGRLGDRVEAARLDVRLSEIRTGVVFVDRAVELANLREELAAVDQEYQKLEHTAQEIERLHGGDSATAAAAAEIRRQLQQEAKESSPESRMRRDELEHEAAELPAELRAAVDRYLRLRGEVAVQIVEYQRRIAELERLNADARLMLRPAGGEPTAVPCATIVRAYPANRLSWFGKLGVYGSRWWEFLTDVPREANSEGGVFPAIFGTVAMTLVMSLIVVPFGVLAALYLREYARGGLIVSVIRIAINNLAGVPSIVFGVFGLGFFCYLVGAYLDGGPRNTGVEPLAPHSWYLGLGLLAVVAVGAFLVSLGRNRTHGVVSAWIGRAAVTLWIAATLTFVYLVFVSPFFDGLFAARLPNPTLGKGGLLWSSLTLALLTLPVVIVSTEEALSAVPNSMREGSYACGAGKWQTIRRIVLPQALPGIMTGMILAMARGAGEVAPLMLVGAVKVAPELPVDGAFPFVHPERSYLHLGFHIFDLGFQSQNSEAAKPMVFTTTLLLIAIIALLNIFAVWLRGRLRRRFRAGQF